MRSTVEGTVRRIGDFMVENASVQRGEFIMEIEPNAANLNRLVMEAPCDGYLIRLNVFEQGRAVKEGDPLFTIFPDTSQRAVELWISGNDMPLVQEGNQVRLEFEGWPTARSDGAFGGEVMGSDFATDDAGKFRILVIADGNDAWPDENYLRPGVRANGWIFTDSRSDTKSGGN